MTKCLCSYTKLINALTNALRTQGGRYEVSSQWEKKLHEIRFP